MSAWLQWGSHPIERKRGFGLLQEQRGLWTCFFHWLVTDPEQKPALRVAPSEGDELRAGICLWAPSVSPTVMRAGFVLAMPQPLVPGDLEQWNHRCPPSPGLCMFPSASRRLQQIRVCFNHFAVTERSRHFQGLTHLTYFRNVPGDETNCIPAPLKAIQMMRSDANPCSGDRWHPPSTHVLSGYGCTKN